MKAYTSRQDASSVPDLHARDWRRVTRGMGQAIKRKGAAIWRGTLKDGSGAVSSESGVLNNATYSFASRFVDGIPRPRASTNPEELIAAAHAACYSMALSAELEKRKARPNEIQTQATVNLVQQGTGWVISEVNLEVGADADDIDERTFDEAANEAKANCPVSRLLNARITLHSGLRKKQAA